MGTLGVVGRDSGFWVSGCGGGGGEEAGEVGGYAAWGEGGCAEDIGERREQHGGNFRPSKILHVRRPTNEENYGVGQWDPVVTTAFLIAAAVFIQLCS